MRKCNSIYKYIYIYRIIAAPRLGEARFQLTRSTVQKLGKEGRRSLLSVSPEKLPARSRRSLFAGSAKEEEDYPEPKSAVILNNPKSLLTFDPEENKKYIYIYILI